MKRGTISVIMMVFLLAAGMQLVTSFSFASAAQSSSGTFAAQLSAASGVSSQATGNATFQLSPDGQSISYKLVVSNINNVFMAHIHLSPSGNIAVWLYPSPNTVSSGDEKDCIAVLSGGSPSSCTGYHAGRFDGVLAQGTITAADLSGSDTCAGCSGLSPLTISGLISQIESGNTFVNVHTTQNPAGEIQGTIAATGTTSTAPATVPEFGSLAVIVITISIISVIVISTRSRLIQKA
jgi:predicted secreted protein with PEFG-CTERM motif